MAMVADFQIQQQRAENIFERNKKEIPLTPLLYEFLHG